MERVPCESRNEIAHFLVFNLHPMKYSRYFFNTAISIRHWNSYLGRLPVYGMCGCKTKRTWAASILPFFGISENKLLKNEYFLVLLLFHSVSTYLEIPSGMLGRIFQIRISVNFRGGALSM